MRARPIRSPATRLLLVAIPGIVIGISACLGPGGSPTISIGEVTTTNPSPTSTASGLDQLPDVPAGFPVMPGMTAVRPLPSSSGLIARWTTSANGAQVYSFLEGALPKAGYRVDLLGPGDTVAFIRFTPPGGEQLQIDHGQEGAGTFMELRLPHD
jgi:hypothetical protein